MEALEGRAGGEYFDLTMKVGGQSHRARSGEGLVLRLDDGQEVALDLVEAELVHNVDDKDDFGALCERGLVVERFFENAPGDYVKVHITGFRVKAETPICVLGSVEQGAEPGTGYRDTGALRPQKMRVRFLAAGDEASEEVEKARRDAQREQQEAAMRPTPKPKPMPKPKPKPDPRVPLHFPAIVLLCAVVAFGGCLVVAFDAARFTDEAGGYALVGLYCLAAAIFLARRRRFLPDLRDRRENTTGRGKRTALNMGWAVTLMLGTPTVLLLSAQGLAVGGVLVAVIAFALMTGLVRGFSQHRAWRRLRILAKASPAIAEKRWCALDGRVANGKYERTRSHLLERYESTDSEGKRTVQTWWEFSDSVHMEALTIQLDSGDTLRLDVVDALMAGGEPIQKGNQLTDEILPGHHVRVVGRPERSEEGWTIKSTGVDSLMVLGSRRHPAAVTARRALLLHSLALGALLAISVAGVLLVLH